nr:hypothetical protein K-LCC10_0012 [Kaumoebavirus]
MLRKIVEPGVVEALDSWLPREITDVVLDYYMWRPELAKVRAIAVYYPASRDCVYRISGRAQYFAHFKDGEIHNRELGFISAVSQGIRFVAPMDITRKNLRRFLRGIF